MNDAMATGAEQSASFENKKARLANSLASNEKEQAEDSFQSDFEQEEFDDIDVEFPIDCFPPYCAKLVRQFAEMAMVPPQLIAMQMLATVSGSAGRSFYVRGARKDFVSLPNLYILAVAESSCGKDVSGKVVEPLKQYEKRLADEYAESYASADKATRRIAEKTTVGCSDKEKLAEAYKTLETTPTRARRLTCGNTTGEALGALLQEFSETLFQYSTEAGDVLRTMAGKHNKIGGDFSIYNGAWSGSDSNSDRITRDSVRLDDPCLSMFLATQGNYFEEIAGSREANESGFIPRGLIFEAKAGFPLDDGKERTINAELFNQWTARITQILDCRINGELDGKPLEERVRIQCTPEAKETFRNHFNATQIRIGKQQDLSTLLGKNTENVIRISLCLALMDNEQSLENLIIDEPTALNAVILLEWLTAQKLALLNEGIQKNRENRADKLEGVLNKSEGEKSFRDLKRLNSFDADELEFLASQFPERFTIAERSAGASGGRPSKVIKLTEKEDVPDWLKKDYGWQALQANERLKAITPSQYQRLLSDFADLPDKFGIIEDASKKVDNLSEPPRNPALFLRKEFERAMNRKSEN